MTGDGDDHVYDEAAGERISAAQAAGAAAEPAWAVEVRDSVGDPLRDGDRVILIKDLAVKGAGQTLKRSTLIKSIRLTGDPQEIDCRCEGIKGPVLRAESFASGDAAPEPSTSRSVGLNHARLSLTRLGQTARLDGSDRAVLPCRRSHRGDIMRSHVRAAGLALIALGALSGISGAPLLSTAPAQAAPAPQRIGGTWDLTWTNRRGEIRRGSMVVEQRGKELVAQVYDRGGATATGSISGSSFTLEGSRLMIPFTVTGRVQKGKMVGSLTALGVERRFTGIRRGRR
jgi:protein PhnA